MRLLRRLDVPLLMATLATVLIGIIAIYSATYHNDSTLVQNAWIKQLQFAILAFAVAIAVVYIPEKVIYSVAYLLYLFSIASLVAVLMWGTGDATRWLRLGPVMLQPSELTKIATIIALARYLSDRNTEHINSINGFLGALFLVLVPIALIVPQPDLGTAISLGAPFFPMLYWVGLRRFFIFLIISPLISVFCSLEPLWQWGTPYVFASFIIGSTLLIHRFMRQLWLTIAMAVVNISAGLLMVYFWENFLRPYQKARITTFLNPESDPLGDGWNIIQSKIAIGSGGLTGKGLLEGTQTKHQFLPAAHTDFIFSVIAEEGGFVMALIVLGLFFFLIYRALHIASMANNAFYGLTALGLAAMLTFHVFINVGMTIGVMPITGLPLPFLSSGGSSLLSNLLAIGLLLHIGTYRHEF
ncbi:MAG: rod shape-determining protein RodA [Gemmatimonadetes bacterium]|nr:rod shape-determining protein RodA [Gemmatimonadota bacterium]MXY82101.1 rod shape-determining protein RodA [Gemmatimonadota bacterium]MYA22263.1 rod shape-determining protein RodA [Gemmatimonadota bacterium]MYB67272.1 rod shape-determining protein RodA [Gemmatimonadota bacterium]